jgi:hypothetical protein
MSTERDQMLERDMRASFEASLPHRLRRASRVKLQNFIPAHWFAAAASECAGMYIAGFFYGAISVAQAYVEALSRFLAEHHRVRVLNDVEERCRRLHRGGFLSDQALNAAVVILEGRNNFHHLNREVPQDYQHLQTRAEQCINHLHTIESDIFAYSFSDEPGKLVLKKPEYWPSGGPGLAQVGIRQLW